MKHQSLVFQLRKLVSLACDGMADERDQRKIEQLLQDHPGLLDDYAAFVANDAVIEVTCGKSTLELPASEPSGGRHLESPAIQPKRVVAVPQEGSASGSWREWGRAWLPYAVSAAVLLSATAWFFNRPGAYLASSDDARWADRETREVGSPIGREWLELEEGNVRLSFRSGAQVAIGGPAVFRVIASNSSELRSGILTAQVPESAHGFVVETPQVRVIDLGTSFRVSVHEQGQMDCHVTGGTVELRRQGSAERVTLKAGSIATLKDVSEGISVTDGTNRVAGSSNVRFLSDHPASLGYNAFDHDDQICVFLESHKTPLSEDLRVNILKAGRHDRLDLVGGRLPKGMVVDCYMVHCSPERRRHVVEGRLRFPGEVVGMICDSDGLNSTNGVLGANWTLQCAHAERGLESVPDRNSDMVSLSDDRRTVTLRLRTESIDQLRVLVAAD